MTLMLSKIARSAMKAKGSLAFINDIDEGQRGDGPTNPNKLRFWRSIEKNLGTQPPSKRGK